MLNLSGGELQRVALTLCLGKPADVYLIDEPSAYLDSEQRLHAAKVIKRSAVRHGSVIAAECLNHRQISSPCQLFCDADFYPCQSFSRFSWCLLFGMRQSFCSISEAVDL